MKCALVAVLLAADMVAGCSNAAVSKAVGTGGSASEPIAVIASGTGVTVENRAGRPTFNRVVTLRDSFAKAAK